MDESLELLIANDVYESTFFIECGFPRFMFSTSRVWIDCLYARTELNYLELVGNLDADVY